MRNAALRPVAFASLLLAALAWGQAPKAGDELTSLSYISYLERYATITPASQRETLDAVVNMPVLPGDRLETARGARLEVQLADGCTLWLDQLSTLDLDSIANSRGSMAPRTVLYLAAGGLALEVPASSPSVRVDSSEGTVYLTRAGLYRLQLARGQLRVAAFTGTAELPAGMGSVLLRAGFASWVANGEEVQRVAWRGDDDDFWRWVLERRSPPADSKSLRYVAAPRAYLLDSYGDWVYVEDLGSWGWRPRVTITWVPYRYGRWYWTPAGWCWVSYEPWGWYPYHYGSWYFSVSLGWVWFWDPVWAPAWVHWMYAPGYVGWCPRGYYDWWWWRHCRHCGPRRPHRWTEVSFDFSGRVRLGDIDHRPWTFVAEDRFTSSHLERVRLAPEEVVRQLGPQREAFVRSGPLVGPPPSSGRGTPSFREVFGEEGRQPGREVSSYLRRQPLPAQPDGAMPSWRRTAEAVREVRFSLPREAQERAPSSLPRNAGPGLGEREREPRPSRQPASSGEERERRWAPRSPGDGSAPSRRPGSWQPVPGETPSGQGDASVAPRRAPSRDEDGGDSRIRPRIPSRFPPAPDTRRQEEGRGAPPVSEPPAPPRDIPRVVVPRTPGNPGSSTVTPRTPSTSRPPSSSKPSRPSGTSSSPPPSPPKPAPEKPDSRH